MDIKEAGKEDLSEIKSWFFKENIRLAQAKQELEEERQAFQREKEQIEQMFIRRKNRDDMQRKRLKKEQELFDKKLEILQKELRQLADERQKLENEKVLFNNMKKRQTYTESAASPKLFFKGVNSETTLKKRYRDLLKIFHPDNLNGDTDTIQNINREYNALKRIYCI